ncbi:mechanosensitive ion channel protein 10-like [Euphorbia lathyris]|uniref:mechanosensitive ion channel protein 10-like n=1 Tax=Euphorbia lathyris TaxID=212925 RepID=UPI003313E5AB
MAGRKEEINIQITDMNSTKQKPVTPPQPSPEDDQTNTQKFEKLLMIMETTAFICIVAVLIASFASTKLHNKTMWDTKIWRWCLLIMSILCGRLAAYLITQAALSYIWKSTWVDEKVLYFAYGVKKSIILFLWLSSVTIIWVLLFHHGVKRGKHDKKIVRYITKCLAGGVVGAAIWMVKSLGVQGIGSVHARKLFNKIKYIITFRVTLLDISRGVELENSGEYTRREMLDELIKSIRGERLKSFSYHHCETCKEIANAKDAREAAELIFLNLGAQNIEEEDEDEALTRNSQGSTQNSKKPKCYLDLEKLLKCVRNDNVRKHFEAVAECKKISGNNINNEEETLKEKHIKRSIFRKWLVDVYNEYESLNNTLIHTKMAIDDFDKIISICAIVIIIIVWLLFIDVLTIKALVFLSSQFVLLGFIFGNTMKTLFEAVIFVFFIHPFDVGDRCIVDDVELIVDEERMLSTKFLKPNGEKVYYPNSILFTKPISNLYRSPAMGDSIELAIDLSTPIDVLEQLHERIRKYLGSNPRRWKEGFSLVFKEIEDVNKMKVVVGFGHTVNFHHASKRSKRRSLLVLEMKIILEDLKIKYHLLPREVHLKYI